MEYSFHFFKCIIVCSISESDIDLIIIIIIYYY